LVDFAPKAAHLCARDFSSPSSLESLREYSASQSEDHPLLFGCLAKQTQLPGDSCGSRRPFQNPGDGTQRSVAPALIATAKVRSQETRAAALLFDSGDFAVAYDGQFVSLSVLFGSPDFDLPLFSASFRGW
jgi:hypothetical protein